jgi:hypothetical protein
MVDSVESRLQADVEGLTIYYAAGGAGYLIASSQGADEFAVYDREPPHSHLGNFRIVENAGAAIDDVSGTDGIDVMNAPLGSPFPSGVFVAQDGRNDGARGPNQNYKLVPWQSVANAMDPPLTIDTSHRPRGGDGEPFVVTAPLEGELLDCSPDAPLPVISWSPGDFDRFRVQISWRPDFRSKARVTSGKRRLRETSWTLSPKKWAKLCRKESEGLHIRVRGVDDDRSKKDPLRKGTSPTVTVDVVR